MSIEIHDVIGALVVLAVLVLMAWIIVYSAARMAVQDVVAGPVVLAAAARDRGERVSLTLTNSGSRPAYDVRLMLGAADAAGAAGNEVATLPVLAPGLPIEVEVARAALVADSADPLPRMLRAGWRKSTLPRAATAFDDIPVVLLEQPAATDGA
jgi:hypothetical protein